MSYPPDAILQRKDPFPDDSEWVEFNEVRVIGQSSVREATKAGEWEGEKSEMYTITPTSFGPNLDRALGELQRDYKVISFPEEDEFIPKVPQRAGMRPPPARGPSPEDTFRREAEERAASSARSQAKAS